MICGHNANCEERTASVNNIPRDQHNSSHHTEPNLIIMLLFIQNISKFLTSLPHRRLSSKLWAISRHGFRIKQIFFSGRYSSIEQYVLRILAFRLLSFSQKLGQPFRFRIALNAIFSSSLLNKQLGDRAWNRGWWMVCMVCCQGSLISNQYNRIDGIFLGSHFPNLVNCSLLWRLLAGGFEPIRTVKYFEWILKRNYLA